MTPLIVTGDLIPQLLRLWLRDPLVASRKVLDFQRALLAMLRDAALQAFEVSDQGLGYFAELASAVGAPGGRRGEDGER